MLPFTNETFSVARLVEVDYIQNIQTIIPTLDGYIEPVGRDDLIGSIEIKAFKVIIATDNKYLIITDDVLTGSDGVKYQVNTSSFYKWPVFSSLELLVIVNKE